MNKDKILYILGIVGISLGVACAFSAIILDIVDLANLSTILFAVSGLLGIVSFAILLWRLSLQAKSFGMSSSNNKGPKVVVKVVDVKDLPKTREQELYEQYEGLYKQKLITKEELDRKKEELLGKK